MEQLGIQPSLLLAQAVNFLIILFVLTKLLYKPILSMLEKRRQEIEEGLKLAENMKLEEEKMAEKEAKILEKARSDGRKIIDKVKSDASELEKQILQEAHQEARSIVEKARIEADNVMQQMQKDVESEAVRLAVTITERLTKSVLTNEKQHQLISQQVKKLEKIRA